MKRALISVYDKTNIVDFSKKLVRMGWEIVSTGGTFKLLQEAQIPVIEVQEITQSPECLGGRVKTLHPKIHGGILGRRDHSEDTAQLEALDIQYIDMVVNNLYPFKETLLKASSSHGDIIENIDIGGPSMIRAAAKNYKDVIILTDTKDYEPILAELENQGAVSEESKAYLAAKAFQLTGHYDAMIADYFNQITGETTPKYLNLTYELAESMRYGENPHQKGQLYVSAHEQVEGLVNSRQLQGKKLSYNNISDGDAAVEILKEFQDKPTVVAVKHANPCGIASGETILEAFEKAYAADPVSIFGGIIALSHEVDEKTAQKMSEIFLEVIIAPAYTEEALACLSCKKNLRVLQCSGLMHQNQGQKEIKKVAGGLLVQEKNEVLLDGDIQVVTKRQPTEEEMQDLLFAWKAVKHVKSNGIVLAKAEQTVAVGPGQVSRIWALENAIKQGGDRVKGSALASDAFFPFDDCVTLAGDKGIRAIIQPGGSMRDQDSIDKANELGIAMVFTGMRHFKH